MDSLIRRIKYWISDHSHRFRGEGSPFEFLPAQVSMLGAFGVGEAAISISSGADQHDFHDYTIRRVGAITSALSARTCTMQFCGSMGACERYGI